MADFVAVLRKTIGALGENTPEMREKVYEKARATIEAKLLAIDPPPPAAVVDRQRKALEDAIAVVRADYAGPAGADKDEDLEDVFASLKSMGNVRTPPPSPAPTLPRAASVEAAPPRPASPTAPSDPVSPRPSSPPDPVLDDIGENEAPRPEAVAAAVRQRPAPARSRSGGRTGLVAALALLLALAGGGYAVWINKDDLFGSTPPSGPVAETPPQEDEGVTTAEELVETPPEDEEVAVLPPAEEPETPAPAPAASPAAVEAPKFTQRLLPDGTEVDDGPAGGPRTVGEGTSVAAAAQPPAPAASDTATDASPTATEAGPAPATAEEPAQTPPSAVAVGQRAIFYEERTNSAQGSAELGSIVWSIVQEPPGGDLPPEPAIRAEAAIPGKDVQLRMTIRRNGDRTLPASHIVEMIFLTPDGFEGGAIANVSRISFKETEQAPGNPLIGIPAKIADGFFLIALGDAPAEIEANMTLLRRQSWVDIPIVYQTGRRALLSLEKGIPGERVFQEALRAWAEATSG